MSYGSMTTKRRRPSRGDGLQQPTTKRQRFSRSCWGWAQAYEKTSIANLPDEVLSAIFDFCMPFIEDEADRCIHHGTLTTPLLLQSVCSRWMETATSLPWLWNQANLGAPGIHPSLAKIFLQRAGRHHPQLHFCTNPSNKYMHEHLDLVTKYLNRFQMLELCLVEPEVYDASEERDRVEEIPNDAPTTTTEVVEDRSQVEMLDKEAQAAAAGDDYYGERVYRQLPKGRSLKNANKMPQSSELQPPVPYNLRELYFFASGDDLDLKTQWLTTIRAGASGLSSLYISVPSITGLNISWAGLKHLNITTTNGLTVPDILDILSIAAPTLIDFATRLSEKPFPPTPAGSMSSVTLAKTSLHLPNLRRIDLDGSCVLESLRYIYQRIAHAPKLENLVVNSISWDEGLFLRLLDDLPCPIRSFDFEISRINQGKVFKSLLHDKIGPTLQKLVLRDTANQAGSNIRVIQDRFVNAITRSSKRKDVLSQLEELEFIDCLQTTDGLLSKMIDSRLTPSAKYKSRKTLKSLIVRQSLDSSPSPFNTKDWQHLESFHIQQKLRQFQWQLVQTSKDTNVEAITRPDGAEGVTVDDYFLTPIDPDVYCFFAS